MRLDPRRLWQRFIRRSMAASLPGGLVPLGSDDPIARLPADHQAAAQRLVDRDVVNSSAYLRRASLTRWQGLHPDILDFQRAFIAAAQKRGLPILLVSALRTDAEQNALFEKGVTKARAGQSPHNHGMAVDIVHYNRLWNLTEREWAVLGLIGKEVARKRHIKVTWGGDWKFYDPAHWEIEGWSTSVRNGGLPLRSIAYEKDMALGIVPKLLLDWRVAHAAPD